MSLYRECRDDVRCVFQRDPAARSTLEVLTTYQAVEKLGFNCPNPSGLALFQALWPNGVHTRPDFRPF